MKRKLFEALLAAFAAAFLAGCGGDYYIRAYDKAKAEVAKASENGSSYLTEKIKDAKEKASSDEGSLLDGILSPDEVGGKVGELFGGGSGKKNGSESRQTSKDESRNGNSTDRSAYDQAFEATHEDGSLTEVAMCRVVDGDTIVVELDGSYTYVRLIGINTPESVAPEEYLEKTGKENTQEGKDASAHSKELLSGVTTVWLEFDAEEYDPYERILAYVWLNTDKTDLMNMLNARILADGYAEPMAIKPNVRHAEEFAALVDDGR